MKKYQQLLQSHAGDIARIKALKAEYERLQEAADAIYQNSWECSLEHWFATNAKEYERRQNLADVAHDEYGAAMLDLREEIDFEYHRTPYRKPAQQGIKRFWSLAFQEEID